MTSVAKQVPLHSHHDHHVCHDRYECRSGHSLQLPLWKMVLEQFLLLVLPVGVIGQSLHRGLFSSHSTLSRETLSQESVQSWQQTFCSQTECRRCIHKFPWDSPQRCTYPSWIQVCQAIVS